MPFQPYKDDSMDRLFALYQLQQSMRQDQERQRQNALQLGISLAQRGADVSGLLGSVDPQYGPALQSLMGAAQAQKQGTALEGATDPNFANPLAQANAGYFDASGKLVAPDNQTIAHREELVRQRVRMLGGDANTENIAVDSLRALGGGQQTRAQEGIAAERRDQANALARTGAARSAQIAANADAERRQIAAEQRREKAANADEFVAQAVPIMLADPGRQPDLIREATERFGPDSARTLEYRLANATEAAQSKVKLDKQAYEAKVTQVLDMGRTADPFVARRAAEGKAGYDPTTHFYYPSEDSTVERQLSSLASIYEIHEQAAKAADLFAASVGGTPLTGTIEDIKRRGGYESNPYFTALLGLNTRYRMNLAFLKSGANVPEDEMRRLEAMAPDLSQLNIRNGKLVQGASVSFATAREELESMYLSRFSQTDRAAVRNELRKFGTGRVQELESDPAGWINQLAAPTSRGQELLMSVREAAQPPASQPGTR